MSAPDREFTQPTSYGPVPDPHEWSRRREAPPYARPDVPVVPPPPGYNSNDWHPGPAWDGPDWPWLVGKKHTKEEAE